MEGGVDSCLSSQVSLAFPGVTHTEVNPQDAGSSITVMDRRLRKKTGKMDRPVLLEAHPSNLPPSSTERTASRLTGQITGKTK